MSRLVHIVARQVGSAYPLAEFATLLKNHQFQVETFAYELALPIFERENLKPKKLRSFDDYLAGNPQPRLLFTGTSLQAADDSQFWQWANRDQIATVAWVDQPANIEKRFLRLNDKTSLPRLLLANDPRTFDELKRLNPATKIAWCGSPYLQKLKNSIRRGSVDQGSAFFITEPTLTGYRDEHGFDDIDAFILAHDFIKVLMSETGQLWRLFVKLHPRDSVNRFRGKLQARSKSQFDYEMTSFAKEDVLAKAQIILGMRSMFLFESATLKIPSFSFQPGRLTSFPFIDSQQNLMVVTDRNFDVPEIRSILTTKSQTIADSFNADHFFSLIPFPVNT